MNEQLSGGLGHIQAVLEKFIDRGQCLFIEIIWAFAAEDLTNEHLAQRNGQLIDQAADSQLTVRDNISLIEEDLAYIQRHLGFLVTTILKAGNAFCFATPYKPGVAEQESLNTGYELVAVRINPTPAFCYTNAVAAITWGIGQNCENPEMTMKVLDYMYGDPELMNLFNWGIEGVHYVIKDAENDVIGFPDGVDASNAKYNLNMGWELPNQYKIHVWEGSSRKIMDAQKEMNATANKSKALGFMFDSTSVSNEIAALNNVVSEYSSSIDCGAADPATAIPEFNEKLYAAGLQTVMDEKQKQLNEWLENQK